MPIIILALSRQREDQELKSVIGYIVAFRSASLHETNLKMHMLESLFMNNNVQSYSWSVQTPTQTPRSGSSLHLFKTVSTSPIKT